MANTAWAQSENVTNKEPSKAKQRTGVLSSFSTAKVSSSSETSARNILVGNISYQPLVTQSQASVESKKSDQPSATKPQASVESKKPDQPSATKLQASVESKKPDQPSATKPQASVGSNKAAPQSKQTENSPMSDSRSSACRLGGYVEEDMSPEECRRQGGMMIAISQTSVESNKPAPQSKQTENSSMFDLRNSVCRLHGHEKENMSSEECRSQGGVMITTGDVPTYHKPPANGKYVGGK